MKLIYSLLIVILLSSCALKKREMKECSGVVLTPITVPYVVVTLDTCTGEVKEHQLSETLKFHKQLIRPIEDTSNGSQI